MADGPNKSPVWFIIFVLFSQRISVIVSSQCVDGTYSHEGRDCCLCAAGQHLVEHCTTNLRYGKCNPCHPGNYSSHPTNQMFCDPCTSCSQSSENLEEDEPCTAAQDRKCRCKKDHYCVSGSEICKLCHPCKQCGAEGIKVPCAGHNDTVCNDKTDGGKTVGIAVGVTALIVVGVAVGVAVFVWKKKKRPQTPDQLPNGNAADVEMQHLKVDLQPHLSDIARVIGWKDMKDVAVRSGMRNTDIEACELNHPGDSKEQTFQLLSEWMESQGMNAGTILIQSLKNSGKNCKAEEVMDILSRGS